MSTPQASPAGEPHNLVSNLEFHRKRAKALLKEFRAGQADAQQRFLAIHPPTVPPESIKLADAQLVIARENGFPSWTQLKRHIEQTNGMDSPLRPYVRDLEFYRDRAEGLRRAYKGHMEEADTVIKQYLPDSEAKDFTLEDALLVQARQHGFDSWEAFSAHISAIQSGSAREPFLLAFEAIKAGDLDTLRHLLQETPSLASARGSNGNSLLNLAISLRQKEAWRILLQTGASVNQGNNYGWTPMHQAIGCGVEVTEEMIAAGGDLTLSARGEGGTPLVQALFWGNDVTADAVAKHEISPRNLRVAAGLGRLDLLEACFDANGNLTPEAISARDFYRPHGEFPEWSPSNNLQEILDEAFTYACRNGRTHVLGFLLEKGADIAGDPYQGTGIIWASYRSRWDTLRWLVEHGADVNQQATFGGRNHGRGVTALHLAAQDNAMERIRFLVELGALPDIPDHLFNSTAIGWAEHLGNPEAAAYLLALPQAGIINLAERGLTERAVPLLEEQPELVNGRPGETRNFPLHRSIANGQLEMARLLLDRGANPNLEQWDGKTAMDLAVESGDETMIGLLKKFV